MTKHDICSSSINTNFNKRVMFIHPYNFFFFAQFPRCNQTLRKCKKVFLKSKTKNGKEEIKENLYKGSDTSECKVLNGFAWNGRCKAVCIVISPNFTNPKQCIIKNCPTLLWGGFVVSAPNTLQVPIEPSQLCFQRLWCNVQSNIVLHEKPDPSNE